jgi:tRNA threonylcarbamoyladenosine biosynthesis protein TsaE
MARIETASPEETEAAGASLAPRLRAGDVVLVAGELGSGKTTFVRGACRALGVSEPVTSPTFTVGQLYRADDPPGGGPGPEPLEVAHLDLYRLTSLAGEDPALLSDYVTAARVAFVEWPDLAEPALVAAETGAEVRLAARVRIDHAGAGETTRAVEIDALPSS